MYTDGPQANSARTGRRSTGAQPRPRAERRRQRNKRIAHEGDSRGGVVFLGRVLHDGLGIALAIVYSYESLKSSCAWHCTARWVAFEIIMSSLSINAYHGPLGCLHIPHLPSSFCQCYRVVIFQLSLDLLNLSHSLGRHLPIEVLHTSKHSLEGPTVTLSSSQNTVRYPTGTFNNAFVAATQPV
jgi:hypothetical protein